MKKIQKIIILTIFFIATSSSAFTQQNCEGGSAVTGIFDSHTYCMSTPPMTWWAAFVWCQKQGRRLASLHEACPGWAGEKGDNACPNFVETEDHKFDKIYVWTSTPHATNMAYIISLKTGMVTNGNPAARNVDSAMRAFCF